MEYLDSFSAGGLEVEVAQHGGIPLMQVRGELDCDTAKHLFVAMDEALLEGNPTILLDFAELTYIDSAGLNYLFLAVRSLPDDGWLAVVGADPQIHRLLLVSGLIDQPCFRLLEDLDDVDASDGQEEPLVSSR